MILHFVTTRFQGELYTIENDPRRSFHDVCADIWSGQIEEVVNVYRFDTSIGVGCDISKKAAEELCEKSHKDGDEPHYEVADFIEAYGLKPYREARDAFYDRADRLYDARRDASLEAG